MKIVINQIKKTLKKQVILDEVTLELESGLIHGFFGPNGSGKSMLFRAVCGLITLDEGEIWLDDKKLGKDLDFPQSVGVLIERPGFFNYLTGFENLELIASVHKKISNERISEVLQEVGLNSEDKRKYQQYSLGMKQRLGIAQALMEHPELIILDEPTNALDDEGVHLIHELLLKEQERGATILIASHNKYELESLSQNQYKVQNGKVEVVI